MADPEVKAVIPRNMRPRSTPNAEINAQTRDDYLSDKGGYAKPIVKDVPMRGYSHGGAVRKWGSPKVSAPCKDSKTLKCY